MLRKHARCTSRSARYATYAHAVCQASEIANELLASYYAGELDRIELLYTTFISMISSMPTVRTLVPLLPSGLEMEGDEIFKLTSKEVRQCTSLALVASSAVPALPSGPPRPLGRLASQAVSAPATAPG